MADKPDLPSKEQLIQAGDIAKKCAERLSEGRTRVLNAYTVYEECSKGARCQSAELDKCEEIVKQEFLAIASLRISLLKALQPCVRKAIRMAMAEHKGLGIDNPFETYHEEVLREIDSFLALAMEEVAPPAWVNEELLPMMVQSSL